MRVLVVWGLSETIASFVPTSRLSSVDLPAFGRPMSETKPNLTWPEPLAHRAPPPGAQSGPSSHDGVRRPGPRPTGLDVETLANRRHPPEVRHPVASDR